MAAQGVGSVTVVTHSAISRALLAGMAGLPDRAWLDIDVPNALGYTLELAVDGDEVRMERAVPWGPRAISECHRAGQVGAEGIETIRAMGSCWEWTPSLRWM